jgi:transposase
VRRELLVESRKHTITAKLRQIPCVGPIRAALLVALIQTPHRFRTKRQLWAYSGLALETRIRGEHCYVKGQLRRSKKLVSIRGLNKDHKERSLQSCRHNRECPVPLGTSLRVNPMPLIVLQNGRC